MSENQAPGAGKDANQTSAALELLKLRGAISDIAISEGRLKIREGQLQVWVARYNSEAQDTSDTALAAKAQQQLDTLKPQLASAQEELARLQAEKAALTQQQQAILEKLNLPSIEAARTLTSRDSGVAWSPAPPARNIIKFQRRRSRRRVFWFSTVVVLLVMILAVVAVLRGPFSLLPTSTPLTLAPEPTPTPNTPVYSASGSGPSDISCQNNVGYNCYDPEQIQQAFGLNPLYHQGYTGQGQAIVILGLGNTTALQSDLTHFDQAWGLPDPDLQIIQPHGPPAPYTCPDGQDDLQFENTLDVEWSHAIAPGAKIVLIIGDNSGGSTMKEHCIHYSLDTDVAYALNHHLGNIITMSYSGSELGDATESAREHSTDLRFFQNADAIFKKAAEQHVTVLASAGDEGATSRNDLTKADSYWNLPSVEWPASDPYVLAVGGTSLSISNATGDYLDETVWSQQNDAATGGGISSVFAEPTYQSFVPDQAQFQGKRGVPDVSFPADNFLLYESEIPWDPATTNPAFNHWYVAGGTSLSTPCWAGLIAIADQVAQQPLGLIQPALYWMSGAGMHDIQLGDNSFAGVKGYSAGPGYDLASGWGTPIADHFIPALLQATLDLSPGCTHNPRLCQPPPT